MEGFFVFTGQGNQSSGIEIGLFNFDKRYVI